MKVVPVFRHCSDRRIQIPSRLRFPSALNKTMAVIDGQCRKFHQMDDGQAVLFECGGQRGGGARLVRPRKRKNHPPMAPQKIRAPRAAAFGLQQFFVRAAEFAQTRETGNDDSRGGAQGIRGLRAMTARISLPVNFIGSAMVDPRQTARDRKIAAPRAPAQNNDGRNPALDFARSNFILPVAASS